MCRTSCCTSGKGAGIEIGQRSVIVNSRVDEHSICPLHGVLSYCYSSDLESRASIRDAQLLLTVGCTRIMRPTVVQLQNMALPVVTLCSFVCCDTV